MRLRFGLAIILATFLGPFIAEAQVNGVITAPNGKPVEGIQVFINRSTIQSMTDEFGQFELRGVPQGFAEIVAYKKGFQLYRAPMRTQEGKSYNLNLQLIPTSGKVKGKSNPEEIENFKKALLGDETLVALENEKQIQLQRSDGKYLMMSPAPLVVLYPEAGYRITCYFSSAAAQSPADAAIRYEEFQVSDVNQNIAFEKYRMKLFRGSLRHWLMAIIVGKAAEEGFSMEDLQKSPLDEKKIVAGPPAASGYYRIKIEHPITVIYKVPNSGPATSTLSATGSVDANKLGAMINPKVLGVEGDMGKSGLAYALPATYLPISGDVESSFAEALKHFYEKVYIQTDKPYYYPGEPLWFKAFLNYYHPEWRDSLSDVLHIDLIGPDRKVLLQKMFRIEKGMAHGDFVFPDSIEAGSYYLRGFTNLNRNFGDHHIFLKPFRVLNIMDRMDPAQQQPPPPVSTIDISSDKYEYKVRDKIMLGLVVKDQQGAPLASHISVAVTDAAQVLAIPEQTSITKDFPIHGDQISRITELKYRIERGVSFYAQFLNNKGVGEKTQLSFIQWETGDVLSAETDDKGMFWQTGLQFTDSARFSYKSDKAKGIPYGSVRVLPRELPEITEVKNPELKVTTAGTVQRIISEYEVPKDNTLLDMVEVTAKRIDTEKIDRAKRRPYGAADRVLTAKNLNPANANLLYSIVGKVPGLVVNPTMGSVYFSRAAASSLVLPTGPMVTINDIPMSGDAGTVLQTIDPSLVESIEFTSRLNSMYGSQGAYGVIAVYTKSGVSVDTTDPNFQTLKLPGFSKSRKFLAPDYENSQTDATQTDFRSTIYWNPNVETDSKTGASTVSFYAADLPGLYRVVVEGVSVLGQPLRGEIYLTIDERP